MIKGLKTFLGVAAVLLLPVAATAGPASDRLFAEGVLKTIEPGTELVYGHVREGAEKSELVRWIDDGEVHVMLQKSQDGSKEAVISMLSDGKVQRRMNPLPVSIGNPILLTFLESSLRAMANITGGSPFYIRNRMKAALRDTGTVTPVKAMIGDKTVDAEQITFIPFLHDQNRQRMGEFADLELRFILSDQAPGGFLLFSAETKPMANGAVAFREQITYRTAMMGE
jgi:hypothetical protein